MPQSINSAIVVFVPFGQGPYGIYGESVGPKRHLYADMVVQELLPRLMEKYRIKDNREAHMLLGFGSGANASLLIALKRPDLFGKVAATGPQLKRHLRADLFDHLKGEPELEIWSGIGSYEQGSPMLDNDYQKDVDRLVKALGENGHDVRVKTIHAGSGWGSWRAPGEDMLRFLLRGAKR